MKIGIFGDLHYAKEKQYGDRYCSLSLEKLDVLVETFNRQEVDFCVCLGDTIDSSHDNAEDLANINAVNEKLKGLNCPIHFCLGNHDLDAMDKLSFRQAVHSENEMSYYSLVCDNILFVFMDGNNRIDSEYKNGNFDWTVAYVDQEQIMWLRQQLSNEQINKVFVFIHQNLDERMIEGRPDPHVIRNDAVVRETLQRSGKSITVFQGHDHKGGDRTINKIRYITLRAVVDGSDTKKVPYAIVETGQQTDN